MRVDGKLRNSEEVVPVRMSSVHVVPQHLLKLAVTPLCLPVGLGVEGGGDVELGTQ